MIEAFANHFSSHLGRHLFYWANIVSAESTSASDSSESENGFNLKISNLINKFHAPLERGVQILDHLLTLEEEDFNEQQWGSAYNHNYELDLVGGGGGGDGGVIANRRDVGNQEVINQHNSDNNEFHVQFIVRRNSKSIHNTPLPYHHIYLHI